LIVSRRAGGNDIILIKILGKKRFNEKDLELVKNRQPGRPKKTVRKALRIQLNRAKDPAEATLAYAWATLSRHHDLQRDRHGNILETPPIDSPQSAVRAEITSEIMEGKRVSAPDLVLYSCPDRSNSQANISQITGERYKLNYGCSQQRHGEE
jgi:hypothetical protein